ncbi:MAG: amidohydrolase [Bacteroidota bacterium]
METLRVTPVQIELEWENPTANKNRLAEAMAPFAGKTDLLILPEMFTTGFSMNPAPLAETMDGPSVSWMQAQADKLQAAITGSLIIEENGKYYNRLLFLSPGKKIHSYDKKHLFGMAGEGDHYEAGTEKLILEYKGWKICPLICYDLRFPVWARNAEDYDLLIYVANWPEKRNYAWRALLQARAIENQAYVIGVNRVGMDANGHSYSGDSVVYAPMGDTPLFEQAHTASMETVELQKSNIRRIREKLPFLADRDQFQIL